MTIFQPERVSYFNTNAGVSDTPNLQVTFAWRFPAGKKFKFQTTVDGQTWKDQAEFNTFGVLNTSMSVDAWIQGAEWPRAVQVA